MDLIIRDFYILPRNLNMIGKHGKPLTDSQAGWEETNITSSDEDTRRTVAAPVALFRPWNICWFALHSSRHVEQALRVMKLR